MTKPGKRRAYLVALAGGRGAKDVYAVSAATPEEALAIVAAVAPGAEPRIVGGLSRNLVRRMRLRPGEARPI